MEQRTGLRCSGWNIRDVKSYWGKCDTRTNRITFNLRLVNRTDEELGEIIDPGMILEVRGNIEYDSFEGETVMTRISGIRKIEDITKKRNYRQ